MNKERRAALDRAATLLAEVHAIIEEAGAEERDYFDNMPESFQNGDRGQAAEEAASALEDALGLVEEIAAHIDTAVST